MGTPSVRSTRAPPRAWDMALDMPAGVSAPFGYFDPAGLGKKVTEKRAKYFRECELKHGRVAMLAAFGFPMGEHFHPLFGGNIDVPSYVAYQQTPLQTFWPVVLLYVGIVEIFSVFTFENPFGKGGFWTLKDDRVPGDFGWDPMDMYYGPPGPHRDADQGIEQWARRDDRGRRHGCAGARHRRQALLGPRTCPHHCRARGRAPVTVYISFVSQK